MLMNVRTIGITAAVLLVVAAMVVIFSSEPNSPSQIATRDQATDLFFDLFGEPRKGCMRTKVNSTIKSITQKPWMAGSFEVVADEYANGVMAGSYGACPIPVKGLGGMDSEVIAQGHYWFAGNDLKTNTEDLTRNSFFVQYYSASYNAFRYDEIFVYDAEYDSRVNGIEMFETSNMINGVFGNINLAPGINTQNISILTPLMGGTVAATAPGSCITRGSVVLPSAYDVMDPEVGTYLGVVQFPKGFMQVGELFDAYKIINRWPVPGAVIIMYVDRTKGSPNYGYVSTWLIFQYDNNGGPGKNYWWDYTKILKSGPDALRKFEFNPDYYFKLPKHLVDGCDAPGATVALPDGNMTKAWLPMEYGQPGWINGTVRAPAPKTKA